ncbi:caspase family protein [Kribbella sp. NPDC051936]|uniref:caspase family protein n=1 Tax=Kribbella sp. NPDC051936 TaxID=3154946 RepID=UPI00341E58F6
MTAELDRRFVIASGTENYRVPEHRLESVPADLQTIVDFLIGEGYVEQLPELRHDPTSDELRTSLDRWLNDAQRQDSDVAVFYYSGHGDTQANLHYLLAADTEEGMYESTALPADFLVRSLGGRPRVRRLLIVLDTCYSGQAAFNAAEVGARMAAVQRLDGPYEGVWVLTASRTREEADQAAFASAFVRAARDLQSATGGLQRYIALEALVDRINTILEGQGFGQRASFTTATLSTGLAPFLPNPAYDPTAPAGVPLETRARLQRRAEELATHWGPKARGVEVAAQAGWYFTGRNKALRDLSAWLADPVDDTRLRVVTGDPGSGKSAVLGRLVTLSDPQSRSIAPVDDDASDAVPPEESISTALLARAKTATDLKTELADILGCGPGDDPIELVRSRSPQAVIVLDALDEATDPNEVIADFVKPLQAAASTGSGPRLIVATRRPLLASLPVDRAEIDLDDPEHLDADDIAEYVSRVLLAVDDPASSTPYRGAQELALAVGTEVAAIAGRSFLIAQIAARTLANSSHALTAKQVSADRHRWSDVGTAFDRDLERYKEQQEKVRALLTPLAWAEGAGLPRELWSSVASSLTGQSFTDGDVAWALDHAGAYIAEAVEHRRSVYRLYHQEFAEHLRVDDTAGTQRAITAALLQHVPVSQPKTVHDWTAAHPYIRTHLAAHAAACAQLDRLVEDPGFLLTAAPERLLSVLPSVSVPSAELAATAYQTALHLLHGQPPGRAAAELQLAARQCGATALGDRINELPYVMPWTIPWARWSPGARHLLLGRHNEKVGAVAVGQLDGRPIAVTGATDGVRVWDLRTGRHYGNALKVHLGEVRAIAVGQLGDQPIAVTGGSSGMRMWDLRTGEQHGQVVRANSGTVEAVAIGELDGRLIAVTGGQHGVRTWDLRTGHLLRGSFMSGVKSVGTADAIAIGHLEDRPIAVTGGKRGMRMWDLRTGLQHGGVQQDHLGAVSAVAVGEVDGRPVAITSGIGGLVRMWDLRTGHQHGHTLRDPALANQGSVRAVAIGQLGGRPIAITCGTSGMRMWDLRSGHQHGDAVTGQIGPRDAVAVGELDGRPIAVTGGTDSSVRMWDLRSGHRHGNTVKDQMGLGDSVAIDELDARLIGVVGAADPATRIWDPRQSISSTGSPGPVAAVAIAQLDDEQIIFTGGSRSLQAWQLRTGSELLHAFRDQLSPVSAVAIGHLDGRPIVVSGGTGGTRLWDPSLGLSFGTDLAAVRAIAAGDLDGRAIAITGGRGGLRLWDLRTGRQFGEGLTDPVLSGRVASVRAVALGQLDGLPIAVTGGSDAALRVWDLRTGRQLGNALMGHVGQIDALAVKEWGGEPVAITGGNDATVRVWDLRTRRQRGQVLAGSVGPVRAVALGDLLDRPVALAGGNDAILRVWALTSEAELVIKMDVGGPITGIAVAPGGSIVVASPRGMFTVQIKL